MNTALTAKSNGWIPKNAARGVAIAAVAFGLAACGSSSTAPSASSNAKTKAHTKAEVHAVDITGSKLSGVDTQLSLTSQAQAAMTAQRLALAAVAPATMTTTGVPALSLPVSGGGFVFDTTDHHLTGLIDNTGGLRFTHGTAAPVNVVDLTVNLTTHAVTATVNGTPDVSVFDLSGTPNVSVQGVHTIITGLSATVSPTANATLRSALGTKAPAAALIITTTSAK